MICSRRLRFSLGLLLISGVPSSAGQQATVVPATAKEIPRVFGPRQIQPLTLSQKWQYYVSGTFNPASLLIPALPAAIIMADPPHRYPREWKEGGGAFGRNFGDSLATELAADTGRYLAGVVTHEDPRYYPDQSRNVAHRIGHSLLFTIVDRSDHGRPTLAISNFAGAAAGGFIGRSYLPNGYNDNIHAEQRAGGTLGGYNPTLLVGYATQNVLNEFTPELKTLGRKLHLPFVPKH